MLFGTRTLRIALATAIIGGVAYAQEADIDRYLVAASRLYENLEYERALEQLSKAKKLSRGPDDDATIALYEGVILADMGKKDDSEAAFREGLLLKPDAVLPVKVSPKVQSEFEAIRVTVKKELAPILAKQEADRQKAERQKAEAERKRQADLAASKPPPATDVPKAVGEETHTIVATTEPRTENPNTVIITPPPPRSTTRPLPFVLGGIALATGGLASYFGIQTNNEISAAKSATFQDDTVNHRQTAQGDALTTNVLIGVASAAAIATVVAFFVSAGEDQPAPATTTGAP
jgi:tetratricopeptide (TPR) repeat protein